MSIGMEILLTTPPVVAFPATAVATCLHDELAEAVKVEASLKGLTLPTSPADLAKAAVSIDSLVAVSILSAVEPIVGFELPDHLVRTGGYSSIEGALGHLLPRIEAQWKKKNGS
jgi:hypothetical protein